MVRRAGGLTPDMRIAVIGTGNIGGTLGAKWRAAGHDVLYGSPNAPGTWPAGAPLRTVATPSAGPTWSRWRLRRPATSARSTRSAGRTSPLRIVR